MQSENQSLIKLQSILNFLELSGKFLFQNYNLRLFVQFLQDDPEISIILNNLLSRYQKYDARFKESNRPDQSELNEMRNKIDFFDENVAFSLSYLKSIVHIYFPTIHLAIKDFISPTNDDEFRQQRFINECIKPIQIYIELQIKSALHAISILKRYKVYCEWYGNEDLMHAKKETDITKKHLARFLFDSGYTYPLVEVVVPSGRIDNLVVDNRYSVIIEAKIHRGGNPQTTFEKVFNQAYKRTCDLTFPEAFCVIFNRGQIDIVVDGSDGRVDVCFYKTKNNSRIYFLVIDLYKFNNSEKSLPQKKVNLKDLN